MSKLIDGQDIARKINKQTAKRVKKLNKIGFFPKLAVVLVGSDPASMSYIRQKEKVARQVGVDFVLRALPKSTTKESFISELKRLQIDKSLAGLIIQLPLPEKLFCPEVLNAINPAVDVDFLYEKSMGTLMLATNQITPPTSGSILAILHDLKISLAGKNITIVGMGMLVGKPLAMLLINERASVITCNSATKDIKEKCLSADILISCAGKKDLIRGNMVKPGAVVIDAGFSFFKGKSYGDVNVAEVGKIASRVTPTPGGVGPITVALLLRNTVWRAEKKLVKK